MIYALFCCKIVIYSSVAISVLKEEKKTQPRIVPMEKKLLI